MLFPQLTDNDIEKLLTDLFGASSTTCHQCVCAVCGLSSMGDCQSNLKLIRLSAPRISCQLMDRPKDTQERHRERDMERKRRPHQVQHVSSSTSSVMSFSLTLRIENVR